MANFLQKIKEKLFPKPDFGLEDDDEDQQNPQNSELEEEIEDVEVDLGGPEISSARKNKLIILVASSLLITFVIYFFFIKDANKPKERLETVAPKIRPTDVARSEDGKSPFEIEKFEKEDSEISLLEKPKTPNVPKLPEIEKKPESENELTLSDDLFIDQIKKPEEKKEAAESQNKEEEIQEKPAPTTPTQQQPQAARSANDPRFAPIIVLQGNSGPTQSVGYENNIQVLNPDPIRSLQKSQIGVQASYVEDRSNVVAQGKFITAVLETAINTETPGSIRGIVSRDVYGEAGNKVLIPRGSRLYGSYSTDTARGQARVRINWTRLIRPDGVDLNISSFASDQFGRAGIEGIVDNKYSQVVTNSLLTSLLAVAGAAIVDTASGNNENTTTVNPSTGTSTISSTATTQAVTDVTRNITGTASRFFNEYFDARPSITVPQGTRITVLVNSDIKIPPMKR